MKVTNTSTNLPMTREDRNRGKLLACALCVLLALPGLAAAKKPTNSNSSNNTTSGSTTTTTEGCAVLLPTDIYTGQPFTVKVVRVPSYTGSWHQPTIDTVVDYPTMDGSGLMQSDSQTINYFSVTYAMANFTTPTPTVDGSGNQLFGILTTTTSPDAVATVTTTVSEPMSNNKVKLTTCSATTTINRADVTTVQTTPAN
jgi:hypothetical protein